MDKINLGVEMANDLYPNSCSCGIDYGDKSKYKKHLIDFHVIDIEYRYN